MRSSDDMNGARARASRIRSAHDMEATMLDTMHRHARRDGQSERRSRMGVLIRMLRRGQGATHLSDSGQPVEIESRAAESLY